MAVSFKVTVMYMVIGFVLIRGNQTYSIRDIVMVSVTYTISNGLRNVMLLKKGRKCFIYRHTQHILIQLYGVGHMVKDHSGSERGNPLPPLHGLLFLIRNKGSFITTIPHTSHHIPCPLIHQSWSTGWN